MSKELDGLEMLLPIRSETLLDNRVRFCEPAIVIKCVASLLFALLPISALARIGETRQECDARYGKLTVSPLTHSGVTYLSYKIHGFDIDIKIIDSQCHKIKYIRKDYGDFEEVEIDALLNLNGKGWQKLSPTTWKNQMSSASVSGKYLVIETHAFKKHRAAQTGGIAK